MNFRRGDEGMISSGRRRVSVGLSFVSSQPAVERSKQRTIGKEGHRIQYSIMNQSSLVFCLISLLLIIAVIAGASDGDATAATSNAQQQQGRGRGAGLVERMRQRHQRREDEVMANMQERRKGTSRAHHRGDGSGGMGRKNNQIVDNISGPLKKRLEEMRNRRRESKEL